jgi:hypothetical protein
MEVDVFSLRTPDDSDLIDGSIGEGSPFHQTFGYHAHSVGEETAVLPPGCKDRLIPILTERTGGATGLCLELHDLAVSKLVAGRPKDLEFVFGVLRHSLANAETIRERLKVTPLDGVRLRLSLARLERVV